MALFHSSGLQDRIIFCIAESSKYYQDSFIHILPPNSVSQGINLRASLHELQYWSVKLERRFLNVVLEKNC